MTRYLTLFLPLPLLQDPRASCALPRSRGLLHPTTRKNKNSACRGPRRLRSTLVLAVAYGLFPVAYGLFPVTYGLFPVT